MNPLPGQERLLGYTDMTNEITDFKVVEYWKHTQYTNLCHLLSSEVQLNSLRIARTVYMYLHVDVL